MKNPLYFFILLLPLFALWFCTASTSGKKKQNSLPGDASNLKDGNKNIAVFELFTSQGCSSCPPADRLMGSYTSKENTIVLSFHVDYWDRLGWKDPFSSKEFTQRQYNYASALNSGVYTPQLIINGQNEMVGSDENKISATLKKIFTQEPKAELTVKTVKPENGHATIGFMASGNISNCILNIAMVEKKTVTNIKAGENGGVALTNYNVVINFKTSGVNKGDNLSAIDIPPSIGLDNLAVALYLQEKGTNKILAADFAGFR